nr:829_t:CDS:2 [Entrophospora candida]
MPTKTEECWDWLGINPDRNTSSEAADIFAAINRANEILTGKGNDVKLEMFTCLKRGCNIQFEKGFIINRDKNKRCCSRQHAQEYLKEISNLGNKPCQSCGVIHKEGVPKKCEKTLMAVSELENLSHYEIFSPSERGKWIEKLKEGQCFYEGEELCKINKEGFINEKVLSEKRRNDIIGEMERCRTTDQFLNVLNEVEKEIKVVGGGNGSDNIQQKIIQAIAAEGQIRKLKDLIQVEELKNKFIQKIKDFIALNKSNILDAVKEIEEILRKVDKNEDERLAELERLKKIIIARGGEESEVISISKTYSISRIKNKLKEGHEKLVVREEELPPQLLVPYKSVEEKLGSLKQLEDITSFENNLRGIIVQKKQEKLDVIVDEAISEIKREIGQDQEWIELGEYKDYENKLKSMIDPDVIDLFKKNIMDLIEEQRANK